MDSDGKSFFKDQSFFLLDHSSQDILDVNDYAVERYGYSRKEFRSMNMSALGTGRGSRNQGEEFSPEELSEDQLWILRTQDGEEVCVQFTTHIFKYDGHPAIFAVAHELENPAREGVEQKVTYPQSFSPDTNFPLVKIVWDADLNIKEWSDKAEELFGWRADEVVGMDDFFSSFIVSSELEDAYNNVNRAVENKQQEYTLYGKVVTKEGDILSCRWCNSLSYDGEGDLSAIQSLITDVSRQEESQDLFHTFAEDSLVGMYLIQDGAFKYVNARFAEIFGYQKDEIINKLSPTVLTHPEDRETMRLDLAKRLKEKSPSRKDEMRGVTKQGRTIYLSTYGSTIQYRGEPAIAGTLLDVTKDKEVFRKYRSSVETFRDLFDSISDAIYIQDSNGRFLVVNEGAKEMYGYSKDFFIGKTPEFLAAPGKVDLDKTRKNIRKALHGEPQSFKWWGKRQNGEVFPKEVVSNPGTYFGEDVVITIARDISERYKAEEEIRKNEELFRQLFQNAPIPITLMDKRQEVMSVNSAFEETFGYKTHEIKGLNIDKLIVPEGEEEEAKNVSEQIFNGDTAFQVGPRLTKDGRIVDVLIYGVPVEIDGKIIAIFGIYVDITDRKHAEEKVKKSLKEKEVLLAEIHHRVKNNLAVITGLLELQSYKTESRDATDALKASQMRINSIALIHEKLYQNENLSEISFDTYLRELMDVVVASMQTETTDISITINSDPVKLTIGQAIPCGLILNELITNAYKHAFTNQDEGEIRIDIVNDEGNITLTVKDNGVGISDAISLENPDSLGIQLIRTLSIQLEGEAEFSHLDSGTEFTLQFELKE